MRVWADSYRQFRAPPGSEGAERPIGGWQQVEIELSPAHTALVVMHAWDPGTAEKFPGWYRAVEYLARSRRILAEVFPPLLAAVRASPLPVFHVVGGGDYYRDHPGYQRTRQLVDSEERFQTAPIDETYARLQAFRREHVHPGRENEADVQRAWAGLDFAPEARPEPGEAIAENGPQLAALCRAHGINHLVYVGFALNWCLLMAPGGMVDLARQCYLCSTLREAVTAVENRETAPAEAELQHALWRVAVEFGFVLRLPSFVAALPLRSS